MRRKDAAIGQADGTFGRQQNRRGQHRRGGERLKNGAQEKGSTVEFDRTPFASAPLAPWLLHGEAIAFFDGRGVALLVNYRDSPVGAYRETARVGLTKGGAKVVRMQVDSLASRRGGRRVWGFPKTFCEIAWKQKNNRIAVRSKKNVWRWRIVGPMIPISLRAFTIQRFRGEDVRVPVAVSGKVQIVFRGMQIGVFLGKMKLEVEAPR